MNFLVVPRCFRSKLLWFCRGTSRKILSPTSVAKKRYDINFTFTWLYIIQIGCLSKMRKDHSSRVPRFMGSSRHYFFIERLKNSVLSVSQLSSHGSFSPKPFKTLAGSIHHHPRAVSLTAPRLLQNSPRSVPRPPKKKLLPRVTYENVNILGDTFSRSRTLDPCPGESGIHHLQFHPSSSPAVHDPQEVLPDALQPNFSSPK